MSRKLLLIMAVMVCAPSCDRMPVVVSLPPPPEPKAGFLIVRLASPTSDDGAIVFEIRGPAAGTALASDTAMWIVGESVDSTTRRIVLAGDLETGPLVTFAVPDVSTAPLYSAIVLEVANRDNAVRSSIGAYKLTIAP